LVTTPYGRGLHGAWGYEAWRWNGLESFVEFILVLNNPMASGPRSTSCCSLADKNVLAFPAANLRAGVLANLFVFQGILGLAIRALDDHSLFASFLSSSINRHIFRRSLGTLPKQGLDSSLNGRIDLIRSFDLLLRGVLIILLFG
jgi:hypothetical protein